jgi:hypothetical protein
MKLLKKLSLSLALSISMISAASADVIQTTLPVAMDSWGGWNWQQMSSVTLSTGTNQILGLTSSMSIADQGWGGQDPGGNQVLVGLFSNGSNLYNVHVAGGYHGWSFQTFDITNNIAALDGLNASLGSIDWSAAPTVTLQMFAAPIGYQGWELHARDATFTVDSATVPEPASIALLGFGLAGLGVARRRKA